MQCRNQLHAGCRHAGRLTTARQEPHNEFGLRNPRVRQDLPATYATVFRRGGFLSPSHRHGSPRTKRGETTGPKPRWWWVGRLGDCALVQTASGCAMSLIVVLAAVFLAYVITRALIQAYQRRKMLKAWAKAPQRDVSSLADSGEAAFKHEVIRTGGPLKPQHRRLVARDNRLLPKPPPDPNRRRWPPPPKIKYLTEREADRLFGPSLRTRNRDVMDLAADEEQLKRYGLPVWKTEQDVAAALSLKVGQLRHFCQHRQRETVPHYITFAIPKRTGGERLIHAPKRRLKEVLRKLDRLLVCKLPKSEHAHGFVRGRSIASNAAAHVGKAVVIRFDIKDCFPTIHYGRVRGLLIALGYSYPVAAALAVLMTEAPRQPVAAEGKLYHVPTGPRVCVQGA